jgi:hypothetical protein
MTSSIVDPPTGLMAGTSTTPRGTDRADAARDHLWMHFTRTPPSPTAGPRRSWCGARAAGCGTPRAGPTSTAWPGCSSSRSARPPRARRGGRTPGGELAFFPLWSYAHPAAIDLAERLAHHAPGDLNRVFFTSGGGEAVETAWKLAKQYFLLTGKPRKTKVISRSIAYHGTPQGALSITGIPEMRRRSSRWCRARSRCPTPTPTARRRAAGPLST